MSMEIHVLFRGKLPGKPALARAMKELGFSITIPSPRDSLEKQHGFLPMRLNGDKAGCEFDVFDGRAAAAEIADDYGIKVDPNFDRCASFRWGGDENEMITAICASATLAKLVGGVVLEAESGALMSIDEAVAWAREYADRWAATSIPSGQRRGTSRSDLKRYLKPLLKRRRDLVLVDRLLLIRPVRHLIRGVYFEPRGPHSFQLWSHVIPLYAPANEPYGDAILVADVREPHFESLLIDVLAEEAFAKLERITTVEDYAAQFFELAFFHGAKVVSLALAGEQDRAAEYAAQIRNDADKETSTKKVVQEQWERISGDIKTVCEEFHAREAATINAWELEHDWEPSPFPVELPAAERVSVSEPAFSTTPWISRPSWLYDEMPDQPGEVRFGKETRSRKGRDLLVVPLTREEAGKRYHAGETSAAAERLADGSLLTVRRPGLTVPDWGYKPHANLHVRWESSGHVLQSQPSRESDDRDTVAGWSFSIRDRATQKEIWLCYIDVREGEEKTTIYDCRSGETVHSNGKLTAAEREIARCPMPGFADTTDLVARIRSLLEITGYGQWP